MVYERDNQTSTPRNYDLLESVLDYKDGHFIVPESENDEEVDKYGFRTQFSQPIDNELPGKFGTPHTSITPKQVGILFYLKIHSLFSSIVCQTFIIGFEYCYSMKWKSKSFKIINIYFRGFQFV